MNRVAPPVPAACFFERDPGVALLRRATVEGVGTLLLMVVASGPSAMAQHLGGVSPPLTGALATAGALVGLIVALGPVSGGHFNPLITLLQWLGHERTTACTAAYVAAQVIGAVLGALLVRTLLGVAAPAPSALPASHVLVVSEVLAAGSLMTVVFGCSRGGRADTGPFAVGAWLAAAIVVTPSNAYANPAITLAALFATGPIGVSGSRAAVYIAAQVVGALLAFAFVAIAYPRRHATAANRTAMLAPERPS